MPVGLSDDMPEHMPDRVPEDMPEQIAEDMPGRMSEDMPDRMPDRMPEDTSDRMPEDLPVTKRNVMVGITRRKVFLFSFFWLKLPGMTYSGIWGRWSSHLRRPYYRIPGHFGKKTGVQQLSRVSVINFWYVMKNKWCLGRW
jgi:hypothetical protein